MMNSDQLLTPDFRRLFESAPALYLVLTPELNIVAVNDAYLRATMTARDQIVGRDIFEIFPDNPADRNATGVRNLRASLERVLQDRRPDVMAVQKYDVRRPEDTGGGFEERYWSPVNSPVVGAHGRVDYIIHKVEDVTEFVRLRQAGQEWEKKTVALQTRAEQMESEVYLRAQEVAESNRQLRGANDKLERLYQKIGVLMRRAGDELRPVESPSLGENQMGPEEMLSRIGHLMSEHKRLEDHLSHSQKMEAVGQLAGGVAHDFNNLLTVITGHSVLLQQDLAGHPAVGKLKEIEAAAHRAATLTGQLLAFSRKQMIQPQVLEINTVVAGVEELLRRLIGDHITVMAVSGSGLGRVKADPTQLEMVIMNLAINARDAMPHGGRLTIETGSARLVTGQVPPLESGDYVTVSVADTGHGMDADTTSRIFEPFFTTKPKGKGTGLGLATARTIVEQSGGTLTVESAPGKGATFRVYLPVTAAPEDKEMPIQQEVPTPTPTAASVLVVEDHPPLRELIATVLEDAGYRVLTAANGAEAVRLAGEDSIDLVLTDVVMPGLSGTALVQNLRARSLNPRVVFMSGHDEGLVQTMADTRHFLQKPFTPKSLLATVSKALETPLERETEPSTGT
jgi:PAS domain S-box-containing protein